MNHKPLHGEMSMKEFVISESDRCRVQPNTIYNRLARGNYGPVKIRRITRSVNFVKVATAKLKLHSQWSDLTRRQARWRKIEAERLGISPTTLKGWIMKGKATHITRRDLCHAAGNRAARLTGRRAERAWAILSERLQGMGEMDLPKFKHLISAIRTATISARCHE